MPEPCHNADRGLFSRGPLEAKPGYKRTTYGLRTSPLSSYTCDRIRVRRHFEAFECLWKFIQIRTAILISRAELYLTRISNCWHFGNSTEIGDCKIPKTGYFKYPNTPLSAIVLVRAFQKDISCQDSATGSWSSLLIWTKLAMGKHQRGGARGELIHLKIGTQFGKMGTSSDLFIWGRLELFVG